jgi:hypothetical protein
MEEPVKCELGSMKSTLDGYERVEGIGVAETYLCRCFRNLLTDAHQPGWIPDDLSPMWRSRLLGDG